MIIEIIKTCFLTGRRTPTILQRGSRVNVEEAKARALIEKGYAKRVEAPKTEQEAPQAEDQDTPRKKKKSA